MTLYGLRLINTLSRAPRLTDFKWNGLIGDLLFFLVASPGKNADLKWQSIQLRNGWGINDPQKSGVTKSEDRRNSFGENSEKGPNLRQGRK